MCTLPWSNMIFSLPVNVFLPLISNFCEIFLLCDNEIFDFRFLWWSLVNYCLDVITCRPVDVYQYFRENCRH
jgi:hypothetical protein